MFTVLSMYPLKQANRTVGIQGFKISSQSAQTWLSAAAAALPATTKRDVVSAMKSSSSASLQAVFSGKKIRSARRTAQIKESRFTALLHSHGDAVTGT